MGLAVAECATDPAPPLTSITIMKTSFNAVKQIANRTYAVQSVGWGDCDFYGETLRSSGIEFIKGIKLLKLVRDDRGWEFVKGAQTSKEVERGMMDYLFEGEFFTSIESEEKGRERIEEREREEIERTAAAFAAKSKTRAGSKDFIRALKRALLDLEERTENFVSGEGRAERAMDARYCGTDFWADEDYISGQICERGEELDRVMAWLTKNCPLLVASVEEEFLQE